jgi:hypothetical protein
MLNWFRRNFLDVEEPETLAFDESPKTPGDWLPELGLRVAHFRAIPASEDPIGFTSARNTTVVYKPRQDPHHTIEVATAICSVRDPFDRKLGVQLALQRFMSGERIHLPPNKNAQSDYALLSGYFG